MKTIEQVREYCEDRIKYLEELMEKEDCDYYKGLECSNEKYVFSEILNFINEDNDDAPS